MKGKGKRKGDRYQVGGEMTRNIKELHRLLFQGIVSDNVVIMPVRNKMRSCRPCARVFNKRAAVKRVFERIDARDRCAPSLNCPIVNCFGLQV